MPVLGEGYVRAYSKTGYDRRYEDYVFPAGTRCIELVDYVGTGDQPGDFFGVYYCRAVSLYRCFAQATFNGPCIVEIGEFPAEKYDDNGEPISDQTINMAAAFRNSDIEILPHGCSRGLIDNCNSMFEGCRKLRNWSPQEMVEAGIAGVKDPAAPRIIRSNGLAESAFLYNLSPQTMKRMFANCTAYSGKAVSAIKWKNLRDESSATDFALGCRFSPHFLNAIIASLHWEFFVHKRVRTPLHRVNLGEGVVTGDTASMARQLIDAGIDLQGFEIK
jgi:hypothetical protein